VIAANQRSADAKLLAVDARGRLRHWPRRRFVELLRRGDLVVANDAATLPASLQGRHVASGAAVEVRLAGRRSLESDDIQNVTAVIFGAGDYRTRTEDRPLPPPLRPGDVLTLGPLTATVRQALGHPRLVSLRFEDPPAAIWAGLARHGRPIQYAHVPAPLALWDVWTPIAGAAAAFEPPSAGFALDWQTLAALRARGVGFATLTHAAGISSTGDAALDRLLPLDEAYRIPPATAAAIDRVRRRRGRIVAVGTTVVRALEHAAAGDGAVRAGSAVATQRIDAVTKLRVVDAIFTGTHAPGSSHYELLGAFADERTLRRIDRALEANAYRTHEFGDSVLLFRRPCGFPGTRAERRRAGSRRAGCWSRCDLSAAAGSDRPGCRW
jgi:S-adenosylmethionine:tRNA ribosyltransferase-isomerase